MPGLQKTIWGGPPRLFLRLFQACSIPRSHFATVVWHRIGVKTAASTRMDIALHSAQRKVIGAFHTTPVSALLFDTNTIPSLMSLNRASSLYAPRLLSLPADNPAYKAARKALQSDCKNHWNPLTQIFRRSDSFPFLLNQEPILTVTYPPGWQPSIKTHLFGDKASVIQAIKSLPTGDHIRHYYSDGSLIEGKGVGVSVVEIDGRGDRPHGAMKMFKLGREDEHTVYEAELMGIKMGMALALREPREVKIIHILLDNRSAIEVLSTTPKPNPANTSSPGFMN